MSATIALVNSSTNLEISNVIGVVYPREKDGSYMLSVTGNSLGPRGRIKDQNGYMPPFGPAYSDSDDLALSHNASSF
jgi:hypothetical protein